MSSDQSAAYPQKLSALIALKVNVDWRENVGKMHLLRKGEFPVALFSEGGGLRAEGAKDVRYVTCQPIARCVVQQPLLKPLRIHMP